MTIFHRRTVAEKNARNLAAAVKRGTLTRAQADAQHAMVMRAVAAADADRVVRR